jgi:cadmium resistance protein CadD (predicted permease)
MNLLVILAYAEYDTRTLSETIFVGLILGLIGAIAASIRAHFEYKRERKARERREEHYKNECCIPQ